MWAYVRTEPAGFNFVKTVHIVTLFLCFSQVSAPGEDTAIHGRRPLAALLSDQNR